MKSVTTKRFRKCLEHLPKRIQKQAIENYKLWKKDQEHPSLHFKKISDKSIFSIRISLGYRALGVIKDSTMIWFWIGSHSDYDNLISGRN